MPKKPRRHRPLPSTPSYEVNDDKSAIGVHSSPTRQQLTESRTSNHRNLLVAVFVILLLPAPFLVTSPDVQQVGTSLHSAISLGFNITGNVTIGDDASASFAELKDSALEFIKDRELAYEAEDRHRDWKLRGHGQLYVYHKVALAARVLSGNSGPIHERWSQNITMGSNTVYIWNVHPDLSKEGFQDCRKLSIWVRVNGPEIIAGKTQAVAGSSSETSCRWEFPFEIQVAGSYSVDAKLIMWNGHAPVTMHDARDSNNDPQGKRASQCTNVHLGSNTPDFGESPVRLKNTTLLGFKMYGSLQACCEICRRLSGCLYWSTPPRQLPRPQKHQNGCEFYFDENQADEETPTTRVLPVFITKQLMELELANKQETPGVVAGWGTRDDDNNQQVAHFLGCGWSYQFTLESPCLSGDLDDSIYTERADFEVGVATLKAATVSATQQSSQLPLCQLLDERLTGFTNGTHTSTAGRWVREEWPSVGVCPTPFALDGPRSRDFSVGSHIGTHPHCWWRANLEPLNKQCREMNCNLVERSSKWLSSPLQKERRWMGIWRNYQCDYMEFTDAQLSECFQKSKVSDITTRGASISAMLKIYLDQRVEGVTMYDKNQPGGRKTIISTLQWPHLLWHGSEPEWRKEFDGYPSLGNNAQEDFYWITPFFATSEREPYVHLDRAMRLSEVAQEVLTPKAYKMINAMDLSAAFSVRNWIL